MRDVKFIVADSEGEKLHREMVCQVVHPKEIYTILDNKLCKI